jgi:hypothetical protein
VLREWFIAFTGQGPLEGSLLGVEQLKGEVFECVTRREPPERHAGVPVQPHLLVRVFLPRKAGSVVRPVRVELWCVRRADCNPSTWIIQHKGHDVRDLKS